MLRKTLDVMIVFTTVMTFCLAGTVSFVYFKRAEFVNQMMLTLQDQMIDVIQHQIKMPNVTGPALLK